MSDSGILRAFDEIYESTYGRTLAYVTRRRGKAEDIADILQETYAEVYCVLVRKGLQYMANPEAFVLRVARTRLHRHYTRMERMKIQIPLSTRNDSGEEVENVDLPSPGPSAEDQAINRLFLDEVVRLIQDKPIRVQRAIYLHYGLDLPIPEVAAELDAKEATVRSWIYRTIGDVRRRMDAEGGSQ